MIRVFAKHEPWDHRIGKVVADMRRLGPPTLRGVMYHGDIFALEGSHRLAAADYLFLSPTIVLEPPDIAADPLQEFWFKARNRLPCYIFPDLRLRARAPDGAEQWYGSTAA